jgi:DNA-binding response OmpR family regulator
MKNNTPKTIFVIEDDQTMRSLLNTLLEIEGYIVTTFCDIGLSQFIEEIKFYKPDVILMDIHLKYFNGIEALKTIRLTETIKNTCVLISSGEYLEMEAIKAGATGFLLKPYIPNDLLNFITIE